MEYQIENFNGEYDFRSRFHDSWIIDANLHEYSELLYVQSGEGQAIVNGQTLDLISGQFIWIPPNYVHEYRFDSAQVVCAVFSNDFIPLFFKAQAGDYYCVTPIDAGNATDILKDLYRLDQNDLCTISGYLNIICSMVLRTARFDGGERRDGILYQKVISYISKHYTEDISLSGIASKFGYNEKYLSNTLHGLTGVHFSQLLSLYRINHAKQLLEAKPWESVTDIASESGFSSINTFNRVFKDFTGITPSEYRKNFR